MVQLRTVKEKNGNGIIITRGVSHVELLVYQVSMA